MDGLKLGIFGGTFDPPHIGHLILAEEAREQLALEKVLWVVAGQSPFKQDKPLSPPEVRAAMTRAAIGDNPSFEVSRFDLDRPTPHYTVDLLRLLRGQFPQARLHFIMGEDSLVDFPRWREPQEILKMARLAVSQRPGADNALQPVLQAMPELMNSVDWVKAPQLEIASSEIQRRVRNRQTVRYMLPPAVIEIIWRENLYN